MFGHPTQSFMIVLFYFILLLPLYPDTEVVRPYTPVDQNLLAASHHSLQESDLYLMIKVYPDGVFTPYLSSLHIGKSLPHYAVKLFVYEGML